MTAEALKKLRKSAGLSRQKMADYLGYTANYIYLLESGRKPISAATEGRLMKLAKLDNQNAPLTVMETHASYGCRIPADCDLSARLDSLQNDVAEMRRQMDGLFALLGGALRSGFQHGSSGDDPGKKAG